MNPRPRLAGGGCLFVFMNGLCLLFLVIGGWYAFGSWRLVTSGETTRGRVVDIDVSSDDDGESYAPIVEYTVKGEPYQMTGTYTNPPAYHIGERVTVRYDPNHPETARIDTFMELWLFPLIFGGVALLLGVIYNAFALFGLFRQIVSR